MGRSMSRSQRSPPVNRKPRLTIAQVLTWADEHYRRTGEWPRHTSGSVRGTGDETWGGINDALYRGTRGFRGGSTLARELYRLRGRRTPRNVPPLDEAEIFRWAQEYFRRVGRWPAGSDRAAEAAPGETWGAVDLALQRGTRGLPGGSSLPRLLAVKGGKRNPAQLPRLSVARILKWADSFHRAHGHWPGHKSGPVTESPQETWCAIDKALRAGRRGLPGGTSLSKILNQHRGAHGGGSRLPRKIPESDRLSIHQISAWGRDHKAKTGCFPNRDSGPISGTDGLTRFIVDCALKRGSRGLPGGSSLAQMFGDRRKNGVVQRARSATLRRKRVIAVGR